MREAGFSLPAITEFIKQTIPNRQDFLDGVRNVLYHNFPCKDVQVADEEPGNLKIVDHITQTNKTLAAIYELAVLKNPDGTLRRNERIQSIVSLNLDSILEAYDKARKSLVSRSQSRCLHTVESAAETRLVRVQTHNQ